MDPKNIPTVPQEGAYNALHTALAENRERWLGSGFGGPGALHEHHAALPLRHGIESELP